CVFQLDLAAMIFKHTTDDGKAQARAFFPRGYIGFEQPLAGHLRQTDTVVDNVNHDVVVLTRGDDINTTLTVALAELFRRHLLDGFGGILDDVGQRLTDQAAVELRVQRILLDVGLDIELGMGNFHQEHGLSYGVGDVLALDHGLWHAGKARELVDHPPDVVDLAHDGVSALVEDRLILLFGDGLAEFAADALGGQLNRRQRVLDLMGDAA